MSNLYEHNIDDHEDPLTGPTWIVGFLGAVLLVVIVFGLTALYYNAQHQEDTVKIIQRDPEELRRLQDRQQAQLAMAPQWVDVPAPPLEPDQPLPPPERRFVIPIQDAMQIVAREYGEPARQSQQRRGQ